MSSRLNRMWLMPILLLASQAGALGLGEIRLSSALNEPLRAEIELLAVAPDDLINLTIQLASSETFDRYDLDRPFFLSSIQFEIVTSGGADGNIIRVTSTEPISEPFVTFLVEASWSRGRLLREYTLLLDPPTFATAPANRATQTVTAPTRASPTSSGQIQRPPPQQPPASSATPSVQAPVSSPVQTVTQDDPADPAPVPPAAEDSIRGQAEFDATPGGDLVIQRGDTLWGITSRNRPDSRLTMNQTMLAIFEANPHAFDGNINIMRAGATLRIPSADDVFRIARGEAFAEVQRHNADWGRDPEIASVDTLPVLELVPPDEEDIGLSEDFTDTGASDIQDDVQTVEEVDDPAERRIRELEGILEDQDALFEIPATELAALRAELAALRGEEPPLDDELADAIEDEVLEDEVLAGDENIVDEQAAEDTTQEEAAPPVVVVSPKEDSFVDTLLGLLNNVFVWIAGALVITLLILFWFMRRAAGRDDEEATGVWDALDADEAGVSTDESDATHSLRALAREDNSIVVVETAPAADADDSMFLGDTMDVPLDEEPSTPVDPTVSTGVADAVEGADAVEAPVKIDISDETDTPRTLEDTFSSETAINLDQSDPVAEADFHMAYGLYDQAADLINGVLVAEPERQDLLAKLCEIYFVWGNRDGFIDAAGRLKTAIGSDDNPDWDKTVIMGQQIAGEHAMFSGVSAEGATRAVDLSFDDGTDDTAGALDIDFADGADGAASEIVDLGADTDDTGQVSITPDAGTAIDFSVDQPDIEASVTQEMASSPTDAGTIDSSLGDDTAAVPLSDPGADATAEIEISDLGLDLGDLDAAALAGDVEDGDQASDLEDTAESETVEMIDKLEETGKAPALDVEVESGQTGVQEGLDIAQALAATSEVQTLDEGTGVLRALTDAEATELAPMDTGEDTDVSIDTSLLEATGQTQVLHEDETVEMPNEAATDRSDNDATMLAPGYGDDGEGDFAKTEALPEDAFDSETSETGMLPELPGSTDVDLDLDDLTAALDASEVADAVSRSKSEETVEQPRVRRDGSEDAGATLEMTPGELSGDLNDEARTMTEVGTKLDLARAYVDMGDPGGARSILEEVLDEGDDAQKQQARKFLDSLP